MIAVGVLAWLHDGAAAGLPILLDAAIKGAVLLIAAAGVALAMRRASAAARQIVWSLAMAALLALPVLSLTLPGWRILPDWAKLDPSMQQASAAAEPARPIVDSPRPTAKPASPIAAIDLASDPIAPAPNRPEVPAGEAARPADASAKPAAALPANPVGVQNARPAALIATAQPASWQSRIQPWVMGAWIVGVGVVLAPLVLGWLSLWTLRWRSCPLADSRWQTLLDRARATLGLRRRVLLLASPRQAMPMTWGIRRPRLLLPASADSWSADRTWVVLLHELGHVKRWDCLTKLLGHLACAMYWFNPLAWLAFKRLQTEAEVACDDLVLASGHEPCDYADHLLQVASRLRAGLLAAHSSIALARPSKLEGRLLAILDAGRNRRAMTRWGLLIAAILVAGLVIPISIMKADAPNAKKDTATTPTAQPAKEPSPKFPRMAVLIYGPTNSASVLPQEGVPMATGKATFGHPGAVSEVRWKYLRTTNAGDEYEVTRRFPIDTETPSTETKTVVYSGQPLTVFEDNVQRVLFLSPEDLRSLQNGKAAGTTTQGADSDQVGLPGGMPPADESLRAAWAELLSEQPLTAYNAARTLAKSGKAGVEFLEAMVPLAQPGTATIAKLIGQLDDGNYTVRQQASEALSALGGAAEAPLRHALQDNPSPEASVRIKKLLSAIEDSGSAPEARRQTMVVYALELMNSAESRALLTKMAKGATWAPAQAAAALERLSAKPTAVDMSDKKMMLVHWGAVARPEMVRVALAGAKPIDSGSKDFTAVLCDARQLRLAMQPLLPGPDGRGPDLCALKISQITKPQTRRPNLSSANQDVSFLVPDWHISTVDGRDSKGQQLQPTRYFGFQGDAKYSFGARDSVAQLEIVAIRTEATMQTGPHQSPSGLSLSPPKFKTECPVGQALCLVAGFAEGDCRPQVVLVMEPIAVPVHLTPYFRYSNRWVRGGQEDMIRVAEEGLAWNAMAADHKYKANSNWVRTLPGGTQVRIARVWVPDEHPFQTWDGDGNPIPCDPRNVGGSSGRDVWVGLEVRASEEDPWLELCSTGLGNSPVKLEIGLGDGPWQIVETLKLNEPLTIGKQVFTLFETRSVQSKGLIRGGSMFAAMMHEYEADTVWNVGAVDKKGNLIAPFKEGIISPDYLLNRERVVTYQDGRTTELAIDIKDVDHYVLLKRPRQWVTFENFAGEPKLPASFASSAPATQSAKP